MFTIILESFPKWGGNVFCNYGELRNGCELFFFFLLQLQNTDVDDIDAEAELVLNELHLLTESEEFSSSDIRSQSSFSRSARWLLSFRRFINFFFFLFAGGIFVSPGKGITPSNEDEGVDSAFALGELAQLTVNNDVENSYDVRSVSTDLLARVPRMLMFFASFSDGFLEGAVQKNMEC